MMIHWTDDFSLIIPKKTGIKWQHQTAGVCCNQIFIEGIMIPLDRPSGYNIKERKHINYLELLTDANYTGDETADIWKKINTSLEFEYKIVKEPPKQPRQQEGLIWIKITKLKYPKKRSRKGIDNMINKGECKELDSKYKELIGKTIALIYPNCD